MAIISIHGYISTYLVHYITYMNRVFFITENVKITKLYKYMGAERNEGGLPMYYGISIGINKYYILYTI